MSWVSFLKAALIFQGNVHYASCRRQVVKRVISTLPSCRRLVFLAALSAHLTDGGSLSESSVFFRHADGWSCSLLTYGGKVMVIDDTEVSARFADGRLLSE